MIRRGREHPMLQLLEHRALALGLFDFVEALEVRVLVQLRGHLASRAQEYD